MYTALVICNLDSSVLFIYAITSIKSFLTVVNFIKWVVKAKTDRVTFVNFKIDFFIKSILFDLKLLSPYLI
jgi:hypothetical protein